MSMAKKRVGISFTLTLVVIGVVLLMTALTLTVLGGGQLGTWFQQIGEQDIETSVRNACLSAADPVQRDFCSGYVEEDSGPDCDGWQMNPAGDSQTPVNQEGCDWTDADRTEDVRDNGDITVTVQGNEYDCADEGHISERCPVQ